MSSVRSILPPRKVMGFSVLVTIHEQESYKSVKPGFDFTEDRTVEQKQPRKTDAEILRSFLCF